MHSLISSSEGYLQLTPSPMRSCLQRDEMAAPRLAVRLVGLLLVLLYSQAALASSGTYDFPSGQRLIFGDDAASFRLYPNRSASVFVSVAFGKISELDVLGSPVLAHTLLSLDGIVPNVTTGKLDPSKAGFSFWAWTR